eukprot:Ihof_evm1s1004 gene=Ihof_evmTU1s1004
MSETKSSRNIPNLDEIFDSDTKSITKLYSENGINFHTALIPVNEFDYWSKKN